VAGNNFVSLLMFNLLPGQQPNANHWCVEGLLALQMALLSPIAGNSWQAIGLSVTSYNTFRDFQQNV